MKTAVAIFALAALGGLTLAFVRLTALENPPTWMALAHGVVAVTAIVSLVVAAAQYGLPLLGKAALALFVAAALGGAFIFANYHLSGLLLPMPLVLLHGGLAVTAFGLLLAALSAPQARRSR
jgi:hypothetical protein